MENSQLSLSRNGSLTGGNSQLNKSQQSDLQQQRKPQQLNQLQENRLSSGNNKTSWNQRAATKTASAKSVTNLASNKLTPLESQKTATLNDMNKNAPLKPTPNSNKNTNNNNSNKLENILQTNTKIPHPPATRPANTSARKIRLSSAVKSSNLQEANNQAANNTNNSKPNAFNPSVYAGGGDSSNEEDIHNNSSKTLFEFNALNNAYPLSSTAKFGDASSVSSKPNFSSNNESSGFNESMSDVLQIIKSNPPPPSNNANNLNYINKPLQPIQPSSSKNNINSSETNLDDSSNTIVYSFSSKPKPVSVTNKDNQLNSTLNTNTNKTYDYRKYLSSGISSAASSAQNNTSKHELNENNLSYMKDSLNNNTNPLRKSNKFENSSLVGASGATAGDNHLVYNDLIDSFEARMLQEMKAEMDSDNKPANNVNSPSFNTNGKINKKTASNNGIGSKPAVSSPLADHIGKFKNEVKNERNTYFDTRGKLNPNVNEFANKINQKSPDADYIAAIQREASGLQSPLSDDYNHTTSEKYNFDAMTSSIEDTTTSLSKKTVNSSFCFCLNFLDLMNKIYFF